MADDGNVADLENVLPEFRDIFEEVFIDDDSDEFEGFDSDDCETETAENDVFAEESWREGTHTQSTFTFVGNAGIHLPEHEHDDLSYLDFFQSIVTHDVIDVIVIETNRYATQYLQSHPSLPLHSRIRKWTPVSVAEMKAFLAMTIAMGLVKQANMHDYWSTDPVINTPFFGKLMSRDRFLAIMSFLHLSDNTEAHQRGQVGYSPLQKLGKPYQDILTNFQRVYCPGQHIAVDEGMIPWRGNLNFRVYSPDKPVKYGLKVYMLCDSSNGYCCRLELYTGREGQQASQSTFGLTYDLVMRLVSPYLNKGYHLYMDNYFSSPHLFYNLYLNATLACGTVRSNRRGIPQSLKSAKPAKGEIFVVNNGTLVGMKYADKKDVCLLTTIHEGSMVDTGKRDHDGNLIRKPDCVLSYNRHMGAVDRCDQMVAYGSFDRRTLKWWKKVFFHMLGLAVLNAYLLYKYRTPQPVQQRVFRRELVAQMVEAAEVPRTGQKGRKVKSAENLQRLTARHFLSHLPSTNKRAHGRRQCIVCGPAEADIFKSSNPGIAPPKRTGHETCFQCQQCCVPLCIEPCFQLYHTKSEYILAYKRQKLGEEAHTEE